MSRIGKVPIQIDNQIEVIFLKKTSSIVVKGSLGELSLKIDPSIGIEVDNNLIQLTMLKETKRTKSLYGLYRMLISNMVNGVRNGYVKRLTMVGVGYRAQVKDDVLELMVGFSHSLFFIPPPTITIEVAPKSKGDPTIIVKGIDKQLVGAVSAKIRSFRKPEPYKGKGIRYENEYVRRKAGKRVTR